ncbi:HSP20-like chaperone [Gloeophyllum trabeum ATCC 11539]|uniref:HSP20-like chaperone n=1 Tax=Gloeophyllum trabeum (strain ATCC 11539 / FP-39264 / Madison 617) TaxID=670483 RepID=S7RZD4_GLOTA|nr:HSP20-like chaperone [Gloeophyllum trabeum ATCC 11539]EPQ60360.1 HSP20-like chaperone [Gloeophyllum trabeum ATCC 11539]
MSRGFYDPFAEFDRLFDEAFNARNIGFGGNSQPRNQLQRRPESTSSALRPRMDLHEDVKQNAVTATFELPGLRKEDVNIDFNNGRLTVSGESKQSADRDEAGYAVRERRYGRFSRTLQLPNGVKPNDIKASMENGVLTVTFPRASAEQTPRRITVS